MTIKNNAMQQMVNGSLAEVSKPVAEVALLNKDAFARIGNLVNGLIEAENRLFEGDTMLQTCALGLAKHFGTNPSYEYWVATADSFKASYLARVQHSSEESAQKAWERLCKRMAKECGLEKPKAPSKDANRMSAKRAEEQAKMQAIPDSQLLELVAEYKAVDNFKDAEKVKKEIERRSKEKNKGVEAQVKELREDIRKRVGKVSDLALLKKISALLPKA
jgi:predicted transglutaminase-like cysteine proteinase